MFGNHKRLEKKLREGGRSAPATVLSCKAEGTITHGNAQLVGNTQVICKLQLRVEPEGRSVFTASTSARFSQFGIPTEGDTLTVLYDPSDHGKVIVDQSEETVMHQVLAKQVARFRGMDNELGTTIADRLEAANRDGSLPALGNSRASIQAYNAAFRKIVDDSKQAAGVAPGPAIFVNGQQVDVSALRGVVGGGAGGGARTDVDQLTKLAALRDRGVLTEAEFTAEKAKILGS